MSVKILVFAEVRNGEIKKAAFEALGVAGKITSETGGSVAAVIVGSGLDGLHDELAGYGATEVFAADAPALKEYSPDGYASIIGRIAAEQGHDIILTPATAMGIDLGPRSAARLDAGMVSDCISLEIVDGEVVYERTIYGGKAVGKFKKAKGEHLVVGLRPNVFPVPEKDDSASAEKKEIAFDLSEDQLLSRVTEILKPESEQVDVTEAAVVVSGGRGMKEPGNFTMLEELAGLFNGAVGASRAAVDADWIPHAHQVGQTGKVVTPDLYIACGISGAIQHQAGMRSAKYIIAINKDPDAPIFKLADFGIVGDLFEVLPKLKEQIKAAM